MDKRAFLAGRARRFRFATRGILLMLGSERNAWLHAIATIGVVAAGVALNLASPEWRWVILAIAMVWTAEAFNTAFELLAGVISPNHNPIVGKAKDVAAGAVLISALCAAVIGGFVFLPRLVEVLRANP